LNSKNNIIKYKTKARSSQINGICERFHKTILQEFYQITFRKKIYDKLEDLQQDLNDWLVYYNSERTHQGKMCCSRMPIDTLLYGKNIWSEKT
jgi:transposase InsO family protein